MGCVCRLHGTCQVNLAIAPAVPELNAAIGSYGLTSDYFRNADDSLFVHISCLFTSIVVHGIVPHSLLSSTIVPVPKGRNANLCDGANF